jgi:hypothetical protein
MLIARRKFLTVATFLDVPSDGRGERLTPEAEKTALNQIVGYMRQNQMADRISQPTNWSLFRSAPDGATTARFGSYVLDLRQSTSLLWAGIHPKQRNMIRAAEKAGVRVLSGPERITDFYNLYAATMARNSMKAESFAFFQDLVKRPSMNIHCGVAYDGTIPLGAVFVPYTGHGGFYVYGATADTMTIKGANSYLHYHTILALRDIGAAVYDMVGTRLSDVTGTKLSAIQQFKARYGGKLHEGLLWKMDLNKTRCLAFDGLLTARLWLNGIRASGDIIDQESRKC